MILKQHKLIMALKRKILNLITVKYLQKMLTLRKVIGGLLRFPNQSSPSLSQLRNFLNTATLKNAINTVLPVEWQFKQLRHKQIIKGIKKRAFHFPVQYIVPFWYFRSLAIRIAPPLLIPRFQTQYFVSLMLEKITNKWPKGSHLKVVDFCCGSGVIGLSILKQLQNIYDIQMIFLDISEKATKYTRINCTLNNIPEQKYKVITGDLLEHLYLVSQCQVILSNPPYIPSQRYRKLQKQIRLYEDKKALVSGNGGMELVQPLVKAVLQQKNKRQDLIAGIQFDGQSVEYLMSQGFVVNDQYNKRRFLIFD